MSRETLCALEAESILIYVRSSFHNINADESLTEADKKQLKDFYLQHMIAPHTGRSVSGHSRVECVRGTSVWHALQAFRAEMPPGFPVKRGSPAADVCGPQKALPLR